MHGKWDKDVQDAPPPWPALHAPLDVLLAQAATKDQKARVLARAEGKRTLGSWSQPEPVGLIVITCSLSVQASDWRV
jgi:hypothetical protein